MEGITKQNFESRINKPPGFEPPNLNYEDLSDAEKMALFIYSYSKIEVGIGKKSISKEFNWSNNYVSKVRKQLDKFVDTIALFGDDDGLIRGKGYVLYFE